MKKYSLIILLLFLILNFSACSPSIPFLIKDYQIARTDSASIGNPFLCWAVGTRSQNVQPISSYQPVDTILVFHSWDKVNNAKGTLKEIIYEGVIDNKLKCLYREYLMTDYDLDNSIEKIAKPIFFLDLVYDLDKTKTISFQDFIIRVESADQQQLKYTVISEPKLMSEKIYRRQINK